MNNGFECYKIELLNKLNCFKEAYEDLKSVFDKSFDELNISDWINSVEKNLEKGVKQYGFKSCKIFKIWKFFNSYWN